MDNLKPHYIKWMLHVFWGIWGDVNKFQLHLPQDIDVEMRILLLVRKNSVKYKYKFPFVLELM